MNTNSIIPAAQQPRERAISDLLSSLRADLERTAEEASDLCGGVPTQESVSKLLRLHFYGERLVQRIRALGEDGLVAVTAERTESALDIVHTVLAEVQNECRRTHITLSADLGAGLDLAFLDREQISEAVRCLLDDALRAAAPGTEISVKAERRDGQIVFTVAHRQAGLSYERSRRDEKALIVASCIAETCGGALTRTHDGPWSETALWIPQPESAYALLDPLTPCVAA